jgi:phospholipid/cholesterol/gamma-HCH transport system permease protein
VNQGAEESHETHAIGKLGERVWAQVGEARHAAAVVGAVTWAAAQPRNWVRAGRNALARQILVIGIEPLLFVCLLAGFVGLGVVVQLVFWTGATGQSQLLGPLLVSVIARELGPVLINIVVIIRTGSVMTAELGIMKIDGRIQALEAQGASPFTSLVLPRVLGAAVSTLCLTVVFILVAFASGYFFGAWLGTGSRNFWFFTDAVVHAIRPHDALGILAKSLLPALFTGASCCIGGLGVRGAVTDLPEAIQRALTRSIAGLFVISAIVSLLTYL